MERKEEKIILNSEKKYTQTQHLTLGGGYIVKYTDIDHGDLCQPNIVNKNKQIKHVYMIETAILGLCQDHQ